MSTFSEQREPFDGNQEWDWGRWASEEYAILISEEDQMKKYTNAKTE